MSADQGRPDQMTEGERQAVPLSCGEAWMQYFMDENLAHGTQRGNAIDDMQAAFDAGWNAALRALKVAVEGQTDAG